MGFLSQDILADIRAANDIVDVIQWLNVPLKKAGANHRALCPFHKEKTPSFNVNVQRQIFHCFGCGVGGDVFKFVMLRENLEFPEAVRRLAERAHIALPQESFEKDSKLMDERKQLYDLHEKVSRWYHLQLMRSKQAEHAREYLKKRKFGAKTAKEFGLGYAPNSWSGLLDWAREEKIPHKLLEDAGLAIKGNKGLYDRFRDRLMISIRDESGRVVGFSGRLLSAEAKEAKYVNSPETLIFKKGRLLFGLDRSKNFLREKKFAIICEGQLDWMRCFESGIQNIIAPQGTAFTEDQARILKRYVEDIVLCFDSDTAGEKATWKNAEILLSAGLFVKAIRLPSGDDPDSYIQKKGAPAFLELIDAAVDVFEHKAHSLAKALNMKDARNHQRAASEVMPLLLLIEDEPRRQRLIQNIAEILSIDSEAFLHAFQQQWRKLKRATSNFSKEETQHAGTAHPQGMDPADYLLRLALTEKAAAKMLVDHLEEVWFEAYPLKHVLFYALKLLKEGQWKPGWDSLNLSLNEADKERIAKLLMNHMKMNSRDIATGIQDAVSRVHRTYLLNEQNKRLSRLKDEKLTEKQRLEFQSELLDLGMRIKHL
jgi:DNA primase